MDSEWNEIPSEPIICLLSHCKGYVMVNILPIRTQESIDQGEGRFVKAGFVSSQTRTVEATWRVRSAALQWAGQHPRDIGVSRRGQWKRPVHAGAMERRWRNLKENR